MNEIKEETSSVIQSHEENAIQSKTLREKDALVAELLNENKSLVDKPFDTDRNTLKKMEVNQRIVSEGSSVTTSDNQPCSSTNEDSIELKKQYDALKARSDKNKETLRKLRLVKHYKENHDIEKLDTLIKKWRSVSQEALGELLNLSTQQPPPTMLQLIRYLSIKPEVVGFDVDTEEFDEVTD